MLRLIHKLLTQDFIERKLKKFELLVDGDIVSNYEFQDPASFTNSEVCQYAMLKVRWRRIEFLENIDSNQIIENLTKMPIFKLILDILEKYKGKLIWCGGGVVNILYEYTIYYYYTRVNKDDIDLFFYDITPEEAEEIIIECIQYISSHIKIEKNKQIIVTRNSNVVNLSIVSIDDCYCKSHPEFKGHKFNRCGGFYYLEELQIQFILRIYPRLDLILGGFDIPAAAVAFDGQSFYATKMASWSLVNKMIIPDISRSSTSFEYRLAKYHKNKYFNILLIGILKDDFKFANPITIEYKQLKSYISNFLENRGYSLNFDEFDEIEYTNPRYTLCEILRPKNNHNYHKKEELIALLENKLTKFVNLFPDYTPEKYPNAVKNIFKSEEKDFPRDNAEEVIMELAKDVKKFNYFMTDFYDKILDENIFIKRNLFKIPFKGYVWNDNLFKLPQYYDNRNNKDNIKTISDYAYKNRYLNILPNVNATCLITEKLDAVQSYFIVESKHSDIDIRKIWKDNIETPFIGDIITVWEKEVELLDRKLQNKDFEYAFMNKRCYKLLGKYGSLYVRKSCSLQQRIKYKNKIRLKLIENYDKTFKSLSKLNWITKNPGRQWTSSINPLITDPREWYGCKYTPFYIGIPSEIETTIRCIWKKKNTILSKMPRDLLNLLLCMTAWLWWE